MKLKIKIIASILLGSCMSGIFTSCSSDFLKEYSQDLSRVQTPDDLNELLVGDCLLPLSLYNQDEGYSSFNGEYNYVVLNLMGDELQENQGSMENNEDRLGFRETMFPYFTWQQDVYLNTEGKNTLSSVEDNLWSLAYQKINNCSMVMAEADKLSVSSDEEKEKLQRIKGETYFLRAFYYLTLANLYGKPYAPSTAGTDLAVPVKVSESVEDKEYQRATVADVYRQIVEDLDHAESLLKDVKENLSIYHANIESVYILRSRVALYMQDWNTAVTYAQKAIDNNDYLYNLVGADESLYPMSSSNKEVVFSNGSSALGNLLQQYPKKVDEDEYYNYSPIYCVSDYLYSLFTDDDCRKVTYITTDDDAVDHHPTYHKIDNRTETAGIYKTVSDVFCIRTAEAYLNMAEAKAELGQDAEACSWLTKLRSKRLSEGAEVNLSGAELIQFVREERARELCFEGHRWFDLRRYMVDEKYPYSKEIVHTMSYWKNSKKYKTDYYKLNKNDDGYVLDIPKEVRDFQPSIGHNVRPNRPIFQSDETPDSGDGDDEDDDW